MDGENLVAYDQGESQLERIGRQRESLRGNLEVVMSDQPRVSIGFIGAGWWATENHIPVIQSRSDAVLCGVCGLGESLQRVKEKFDFPFATEDYRVLLDEVKMDGVIVSSTNDLHFEHAGAALQKGIHVLCEKPMVLYTEHARRLQELVERKGLHFLVPYGWNYSDIAGDAKSQVTSGAIGEVQHLNCHMAGGTLDLFSGREPSFVKEAFVKPDLRTWSDPEKGGGYGHSQTTHLLGLALWLTDLQPVEVFAHMSESVTEVDLFNAISVRFRNGAIGSVSASSGVPSHLDRLGYQIDIRIFGDRGMLLLDMEQGRERLEVRCHDRKDYVREVTEGEGAYSCIEPVHRFVDLIQAKQVENRSPVQLGTRVVELLDAAYKSTSSHTLQKVPE